MKRIAHITDPHFGEDFPKEHGIDSWANWKTVYDDIHNQQIDEVICTGDIGDESDIERFISEVTKLAPSPKLTLGNHDTFSEVNQYYQTPLNLGTAELYYSYPENGLEFIYLDSSPDEVSTEQLNWLRDKLKSVKGVMLFLHYPILPCNSILDDRFPLKNRDNLKSILFDHPYDINVFCGHFHMADLQTEGNIRQHITPAISYQIVKSATDIIVDNKSFGYRIIEINQNQISSAVRLFNN